MENQIRVLTQSSEPDMNLVPEDFETTLTRAWSEAVSKCSFADDGRALPCQPSAAFHYDPRRIETRAAGCFEALYNPHRLDWSGLFASKGGSPMDFDFESLPQDAKLICWESMLQRHLVCVNQNPLTPKNFLFVPDVDSRHGHALTANSLLAGLTLATNCGSLNLRLGFNAGTINQLHFHGFFDGGELPIESVSRRFVSRLGEVFMSRLRHYPAEALVFEHGAHAAKAVYVAHFCNLLQKKGIRHNVLIAGSRVFVFVRSSYRRTLSSGLTLGALGMSGRVVIFDRNLFDEIREQDIADQIRRSSCTGKELDELVASYEETLRLRATVRKLSQVYPSFAEAYRGDLKRTSYLSALNYENEPLERDPIMRDGRATPPTDPHNFRHVGPLVQYVVRQLVRNTVHVGRCVSRQMPIRVTLKAKCTGRVVFRISNPGPPFDFREASAYTHTTASCWRPGVVGKGIALFWVRAYFEQWGIGELQVTSGTMRWTVKQGSVVQKHLLRCLDGTTIVGLIGHRVPPPRRRPKIVLFDLDGVLFPKTDMTETWIRVIDFLRRRNPASPIPDAPADFQRKICDLGSTHETYMRLCTGLRADGAGYSGDDYVAELNLALWAHYGIKNGFLTAREWYDLVYRDRANIDHCVTAEIRSTIEEAVGIDVKMGFISDRRVGDDATIDSCVERHYPGLFPNGNLRIFSYTLHASKHNGTIFDEVPRRVGLRPAEILLVEDRVVHVERARKAGWQALHWSTQHPMRYLAAGLTELVG